MYDNASELYNEYLEIYFAQYMALPDVEKRKVGNKYDPKNLFLEGYDYSVRSEDKKELTDIPPMPPLEGDEEEVKEEKD